MNGVRVLQEQLGLRAHSEIKQYCWLDGHCGIQPVSSWVMSSSVSPLPQLYTFYHNLKCLSTLRSFTLNNLINFPFACVGLWDTNFLSVSGPPSVQFWVGSVFHGLPLTTSHDSYFTVNTVGLWLHSSGNGLHKKEVNPHVGTRPRAERTLVCHRGLLVVTVWKFTQVCLILIWAIWNSRK